MSEISNTLIWSPNW